MIDELFQVMEYSRRKRNLGKLWNPRQGLSKGMSLNKFYKHNRFLKIWWLFGDKGPVLSGNFGDAIRYCMRMRGITQNKAAIACGLALPSLQHILSYGSCKLSTVETICKKMGFQYSVGEEENIDG